MQPCKARLGSDQDIEPLRLPPKQDWLALGGSNPNILTEDLTRKVSEKYPLATPSFSTDILPEDHYYIDESIHENYGGKYLPKIKEESETGFLDSAWNSERSIKKMLHQNHRSENSIQYIAMDKDEPEVIRMHNFSSETAIIPKVSTGESASTNFKPLMKPLSQEVREKVTKEVQTEPLEAERQFPRHQAPIVMKKVAKKESIATPSKNLFSHLESAFKSSEKDIPKNSAKNVKSPRAMAKTTLLAAVQKNLLISTKKREIPRRSVDADSNIAKQSDITVKRMKSLESIPRIYSRESESLMRNRSIVKNIASNILGRSHGDHSAKLPKQCTGFKSNDKLRKDKSDTQLPFGESKYPGTAKVKKSKAGILRDLFKNEKCQVKFASNCIQSISFGTQEDPDDSFIPVLADQWRKTSKIISKPTNISTELPNVKEPLHIDHP